MHRVTLQFKNEVDLRAFFQLCRSKNAEMNLRNLTILCHCDEKEIELAINGFEAVVVRKDAVEN